jgi:hypothetical protein
MTKQDKTLPIPDQTNATASTHPHDKSSDFGSYPSAELHAVANVMDVFNLAEVQWEHILLRRFEDVVYYGLAIVPYEELHSLAFEKAIPQAWSLQRLQECLRDSLNSFFPNSKYADGFSTQFCLALELCCTDIQTQSYGNEGKEWEDIQDTVAQKIWVYEPEQMDTPCVRRLPVDISQPMRAMIETLDEFRYSGSEGFDAFGKDASSWITNWFNCRNPEHVQEGSDSAKQILDLQELKGAWRREGYHEHLLRKYIWYKMLKQAPSRQYEIDLIVGKLFDMPWEIRHAIPPANETVESDPRTSRTI